MAAWASLSGYLHFKPGGGALSRLKSRKKMWCVLDESRGQLVYHKSEEEARCKPPMGHIELRGAAISLDLDNQNQFVIIEDGKEVYLTAENHESMMIWLMALQAKRDWFAKQDCNADHGGSTAATTASTSSSAAANANKANAKAGSAFDWATNSRTARGVGLFGDEEQRERVGRLRRGGRGRPSLPHIFFHQTPPIFPLSPSSSFGSGGSSGGHGRVSLPPNHAPSVGGGAVTSSGQPPHESKQQRRPAEEETEPDSQPEQQQKQQQQTVSGRQRHRTSSSDLSVSRESSHKTLCATKSQGYSIHNNNNNNYTYNQSLSADSGSLSAQFRRQQLMSLGQTFDVSQPPRESPSSSGSLPFSRQLSVSMEGTELMQRHLLHHQQTRQSPLAHGGQGGGATSTNFSGLGPLTSSRVMETSSSGSTADSDDITAEEALALSMAARNSGGGGSGGGVGGGGEEGGGGETDGIGEGFGDSSGSRRRRHVSGSASVQSRGSSLSTDSAIEKGDHSDVAGRVQELESELISSKVELAKVMNRQTCFQEILKQKDEIIMDLDEKLGKLGGSDIAYDSKRRANQASRELQERIRILQNQNRFLNEEVRRLARLRSQEQSKMREQEGVVSALEGDIELWKLQYVSLIQSSIRFTGTDTMDDAELSLYGGDRHKNKVRALLEEARKVNPGLPTFENLWAGEVHVDYYGFKHQFQDNGLLLHYLCQELTQHYITQAAAYEKHQQNWMSYLKTNAKNLMKNRKELKALCRGGIPDQHRRHVWRCLIHDKVASLMAEKGPHYYRSLCSMLPDSPLAARYRKQIGLDLMRTMPSNIKFSTPGSKGIMDLQDVLLAFCIHNPNVGYCQGMNFLVAMALLFMDANDAFWTLVAVTERFHTISYFDHNLLGAQADQSVLRDLLADLLPDLARHLQAIDIEISTVTLNWFLAIFFDAVPFHTLLRIWDCFLLEGPKVLFRYSLAILKLHEKEIVQKSETISVMRHLKACARVTYDVDGLVQVAFQGMKPFPRRQDITSKQTVYLKALKEKYRWRELQKMAFAERENLFLSLESETGTNNLTFECSTVTATGEVWVCYGNQSQCKVCAVDCNESTMTDLPMQFSSRVMALCAVPGAILYGTLSWNIFCYKTSDRTLAWEQQLHDAVLSLCQFQDGATCRVFAGLADGTIAVLEEVSIDATFYDVMYIMIGQSPVTCLRLVETHLWCACGNTVSIIHASTLDALDSFTVSSNPYDHILSLEPGIPGVWISVRGSSILELWDPATLCCKMLYDTRAGRYPNLRKDDEVYFNRARITAILPLDYSVWVGTGEGNLITYDVFTHQGSKTPSDSSSFVGSYTDSFSALVGKEDSAGLPLNEGFDPIREAAMRVRQLYLSQHDSDEDNSGVRMNRLAVSTTSTLVNNSRESVSFQDTTTTNTTTAANTSCDLNDTTLTGAALNDSAATASDLPDESETAEGRRSREEEEQEEEDGDGGERGGGNAGKDAGAVSGGNGSEGKQRGSGDGGGGGNALRPTEEDGEALTPTASFCRSVDDSQPVGDSNAANDSGGEEEVVPVAAVAAADSGRSDSSSASSSAAVDADAGIGEGREGRRAKEDADNANDVKEKTTRRRSRRPDDNSITTTAAASPQSGTAGDASSRKDQEQSQTEQQQQQEERDTTPKPALGLIKPGSPLRNGMTTTFYLGDDHKSGGGNNNKYDFDNDDDDGGGGGDDGDEDRRNENDKNKPLSEKNKTTTTTAAADGGRENGAKANNDASTREDIMNKKNAASSSSPSPPSSSKKRAKTTSSDAGHVNNNNNNNAGDSSPAAPEASSSSSSSSDKNGNAPGSRDEKTAEPSPASKTTEPEPAAAAAGTNQDEPQKEGSVIMQVWESITRSRKNTGVKSQSSKDSPSQSPSTSPPRKAGAGAGGGGGDAKEEAEGGGGGRAVAAKKKKASLLASLGSSFTSSIGSRHSESDEVFQDASDVSSSKDGSGSTTAVAGTVVEESESGQDTTPPRNASKQSLADTTSTTTPTTPTTTAAAADPDTVSNASSDEGPKSSKKKARPQSLFVNRAGKTAQQKKTPSSAAVCVDKPDKSRKRGVFSVGSPPTTTDANANGNSNPHTASTSSMATNCSSESMDNLAPADPEAQYRLDYTNFHVDTDIESVCTTDDLGSLDSRRPSTVSSVGAFDASETKIRVDGWRGYEEYEGGSEGGDDGLRMLDCDPSSFIFPQDMYNMRDGSGTVGRAMMDAGGLSQLLQSPAVSMVSCRTWSSYDEVSTPSVASYAESVSFNRASRNARNNGGCGGQLPRNNSLLSTTTSIASTTELLYGADMTLMSKNKISDKPVKCLLLYSHEGKPLVLSFSGCHTDDEAVLKWSREKDEMLWTNDPILEYNPETKTTKLPSYMQARMSTSSSSQSLKQRLSQSSQ